MAIKVLKFGGSSVGTAESIQSVIDIISTSQARCTISAVVVSAFQGITDELILLARDAGSGAVPASTTLQLDRIESRHLQAIEKLIPAAHRGRVVAPVKMLINELREIIQGISLLKEVTPRTLDNVMSFGERLSSIIIAEGLSARGTPAYAVDAREVIMTDAHYGNARVDYINSYAKIGAAIDDSDERGIPVFTGFIGSSSGVTTTLGRGGSDFTAAIVGAALSVDAIEIWTDVSGVMTADPRKVKKAFPLTEITFEEMMELSHFGAKVIYPPTVQPALEKGIPLYIKNTFSPDSPGTAVVSARTHPGPPLTGISSIREIDLLRLQGSGMVGVAGTCQRLFGALAKAKVNVILITQASSEHTICVGISPGDTERAVAAVREEFSLEMLAHLIEDVLVDSNVSIVSAVGDEMSHRPGVSAKLFGALGKNGINVVAIAQGSSERNISVVIARNDEIKALNVIHDSFFLSDTKTINLFLLGPGLIGKTLWRQIEEHRDELKKSSHLEVKIAGAMNRSRSLFSEDGLTLAAWDKSVADPVPLSLGAFIDKMKATNFPHSVFVDCTAGEDSTDLYSEILSHHIAVVTPNKKAQSGTMARYLEMQSASRRTGAPLLYETSVGAALPVISTLTDLKRSGDKIVKIEGILSGTLSFLFNAFDGSLPFSELVKKARSLGYTEPDPREDLNGRDVARKILILGREAGFVLEPADVVVESLVPHDCETTATIDDFFVKFQSHDEAFNERARRAALAGERMRYIASVDSSGVKVALELVGADHPFFHLSGADNIISFTTSRYSDRPLVVRGPGAGAEVTAAGVFADIVRTGSYFGQT